MKRYVFRKARLHSWCIILYPAIGTQTPIPTRTKGLELEMVGATDSLVGSTFYGPKAMSGLSLIPFIPSDRCEVGSLRGEVITRLRAASDQK